ncbi:MAG: rod-binding protein [Parvibaculum sp.]|uniref:rod-binding protein n=1 Tax=Parvibaculum sp. TaxID=2024848 RepID=UPI001DE09AD4|nr:rod-binding protein [Parvibaculum sp.]MBX3488418.1 rod-binding protein [Parvibaculum sp.]MBX3496463.1 rod-binding protein [Parvibaculum sp.]MCW5727602.1 rod-binding protein [Parvibaculum sp.]
MNVAALPVPPQPFAHAPAPKPAAEPRDTRAWETARDFEAQFVSVLLQPMFEGTGQDDAFGGGPGENMFRSLLVEQYGREMVKSGGIGLADVVYREMLKMQEQPK